VGAVVNLRKESDEDEAAAKAAGMRFLHLAIEDGAPPTPEQVKRFFGFAKEARAKKQVVLWHCAGGIGRTGIFAAMLRLKSGWSTKDAVTEMFKMGLNYDQAVFQLPALNNFAAALHKPTYYPADWRGPRSSPLDYRAVAPALPALE
jgi:protein-tyrosine phosphatase